MSPHLWEAVCHHSLRASAFQTGPSVTVTCTEGKWSKQVACEPVDCGAPDQHHVYAASFSCLEGTTFGSKCSFQCRHPAQLKGTEGPLVWLAAPPPRGDPRPASGLSLWISDTEHGVDLACAPRFFPPVVLAERSLLSS